MNYARAAYSLRPTDNGGSALVAVKKNFDELGPPIAFRTVFEDDARVILFERQIDPLYGSAPAGVPAASLLYTLEAVRSVFEETGVGVTPEQATEWRSDHPGVGTITLGTARNHFTQLKEKEQIMPDPDNGGYVPTRSFTTTS
jgi:hypothetical protein